MHQLLNSKSWNKFSCSPLYFVGPFLFQASPSHSPFSSPLLLSLSVSFSPLSFSPCPSLSPCLSLYIGLSISLSPPLYISPPLSPSLSPLPVPLFLISLYLSPIFHTHSLSPFRPSYFPRYYTCIEYKYM